MPVCTESGTEEPEGENGDSVCVLGDGTGEAGEKVTVGVPVVAGEEEMVGVSVAAGEEETIGAPDGDGATEPAGVPVAEGTGEVVFSGAKATIGGSVGSV